MRGELAPALVYITDTDCPAHLPLYPEPIAEMECLHITDLISMVKLHCKFRIETEHGLLRRAVGLANYSRPDFDHQLIEFLRPKQNRLTGFRCLSYTYLPSTSPISPRTADIPLEKVVQITYRAVTTAATHLMRKAKSQEQKQLKPKMAPSVNFGAERNSMQFYWRDIFP